MQQVNWQQYTVKQQQQLLARPMQQQRDELIADTQIIIDTVRQHGDDSLIAFTLQFDGIKQDTCQLPNQKLKQAQQQISSQAKQAIKQAMENIRAYHEAQQPRILKLETMPGVCCEQQWRPIERVGLYIPGGSAPLLSTVLMLAIPAQLAACPVRVLCTPPNKQGEIDPHILYAANECGIESVYSVGGAQAIAAMAYGTETIPKVDKIFGPGNAWVTQAKQAVAQDPNGAQCDMPAGPSEVLVIADGQANPAFVAIDLLSQAEHGIDSHVVLVTDSKILQQQVAEQIEIQCASLSRRAIIEQSLKNSVSILVEDLTQAFQVSNQYGPEHLILHIDDPRQYLNQVQCAGSVFIGPWSPESAGDYASGTNHVLPTYGYARNCSGLKLTDFMNSISFQELSFQGLSNLAQTITTMAAIEGLDAHEQAVTLRVRSRT